MGIRIEDSVCVQEEHPFVLTTEAVKEVRFPFSVIPSTFFLFTQVKSKANGRVW